MTPPTGPPTTLAVTPTHQTSTSKCSDTSFRLLSERWPLPPYNFTAWCSGVGCTCGCHETPIIRLDASAYLGRARSDSWISQQARYVEGQRRGSANTETRRIVVPNVGYPGLWTLQLTHITPFPSAAISASSTSTTQHVTILKACRSNSFASQELGPFLTRSPLDTTTKNFHCYTVKKTKLHLRRVTVHHVTNHVLETTPLIQNLPFPYNLTTTTTCSHATIS